MRNHEQLSSEILAALEGMNQSAVAISGDDNIQLSQITDQIITYYNHRDHFTSEAFIVNRNGFKSIYCDVRELISDLREFMGTADNSYNYEIITYTQELMTILDEIANESI